MSDHQRGEGADESAALRTLPGVEPTAVSAFVAALAAARATLDTIPARLESARVHDEAFGKLIDAHKVRDAYHERLPATEHNIDEACSILDHLTAEFTVLPAPRASADV